LLIEGSSWLNVFVGESKGNKISMNTLSIEIRQCRSCDYV
jgi:hypothetical protein